jgi:hypothetical protein
MRNLIIYLVLLLCLFMNKMFGQETFENRAKAIATRIETITKTEKATLKLEIEAVNVQLEKGTITQEQANQKKLELAQNRAGIIEKSVALEQEKLNDLVKQKVDGKIFSQDSTKSSNKKRIVIYYDDPKIKDSIKSQKSEKRTTSQFVFAMGLNNLATNGKLENSDFKFIGSHFYEWGITFNTRLLPNDNLLHAKYGLSVMYNNIRPTDNRNFVANGRETNLVINPVALKDSRFRNVYLVFPLHLEFDFSGNSVKEDKPFFKTHRSFRLGMGGYAGINLKSKQILEYEQNGLKTKEVTKGDFNTSDFIYGLSAYVGYKESSLYVKYDLNPIFKNNPVKQNNVSLGIRFDFN